MDVYPTVTLTETPPPLLEVLTETTMTGVNAHYGDLTLIGGIVAAVLILLIAVLAVLLWCLSRQKGSYVTNEVDEDDDEESVGSDRVLQTRKPLKAREEE